MSYSESITTDHMPTLSDARLATLHEILAEMDEMHLCSVSIDNSCHSENPLYPSGRIVDIDGIPYWEAGSVTTELSPYVNPHGDLCLSHTNPKEVYLGVINNEVLHLPQRDYPYEDYKGELNSVWNSLRYMLFNARMHNTN